MAETIDYERIAELYDAYVQTAVDVPFFINEARAAGGEVLELMAGTGRVSIPLLQAGVSLTCVDYSAAMLALLREKLSRLGLRAEVVHVDVRYLALGRRFAQIILPFHAFAELVEPADQRLALAAVQQHLASSGAFICTLHNPAIRLQRIDGQRREWGRFSLPEGGQLVVWGSETAEPGSGIVSGEQEYEMYAPDGRLVEKRAVPLRFRLLKRAAFEALAVAAGFRVLALYGDYDYAPFAADTSPFMIWKLGHAT